MATKPASGAPLNMDIYTLIGRVIAIWATLEDQFFLLFKQALGMDELAGSIFYQYVNFGNRLTLLHEVLSITLKNRPELTYWKSLRSIANNLSAERNFIAHNQVLIVGEWPSSVELAAVNASYEAHFRNQQEKSKSTEDVRTLHREVRMLVDEVNGFKEHLAGTKPSPDKFHAPIRDPLLAKYDQSGDRPKKPARPLRPSPA
jgi:hypothetical protein